MTPRYFAARVKAFLENRHGMEEARFVAYHVMKAAGFKIRRLTQIAKFPWDVVVPSVKLEAWDSPAMKKFDEDADRALAILNPAAYAKYMEGKKARSLTPPLSTGEGEAEAPDPDFSLSDELSF